ncbi:MAG: sugar transferase [Verrucomicrobia bacterium]|nr:sugar transferase [Verrucomicrobiota bacterium]MBV9673148.1 sugar transferase [Verrucomicrobiota bacterium]
MLGRRQELNLQLNQLIDAVLLVLSLWGAHTIRGSLSGFQDLPEIEPFKAFLWLIVLIMPFGPLFLDLQGFYNFPAQKSVLKSLAQILQALLWLGVLIAGSAIAFRLNINSRSVLVIYAFLSSAVLLLKERIAVAYIRSRARLGEYREKVILAGSADEVLQLSSRFTEDQLAEIEIVKQIDISREPMSELVRALHEYSVGRVIFAAAQTELQLVEKAVAACEIEGVEAWLLADFIRTSIARPAFDMFGPQPMLVFRSTPDTSWEVLTKRTIDLIGSSAGLVFLSPLMLIAALAIRCTSPGAAIFTQMRAGKHGRPFRMFKFRSMYSDAEQRRHELEAFNQMSGPVFKLERDPRITPLGRILRKYSIDELPQLINVFLGEMSLVGPRPLPLYEVANFANPAQRRRLSVKPGLTCLWQISGRNEVKDFETWVKLDLQYIDNWSIWLDLNILCRTVPAVLFGYGAR